MIPADYPPQQPMVVKATQTAFTRAMQLDPETTAVYIRTRGKLFLHIRCVMRGGPMKPPYPVSKAPLTAIVVREDGNTIHDLFVPVEVGEQVLWRGAEATHVLKGDLELLEDYVHRFFPAAPPAGEPDFLKGRVVGKKK